MPDPNVRSVSSSVKAGASRLHFEKLAEEYETQELSETNLVTRPLHAEKGGTQCRIAGDS